MKKNIKQFMDEEKRISKPICLSFVNPTPNFSAADPDNMNDYSHHLCLKGDPDTTILDNEFKEFWCDLNKNSPKTSRISHRFHSWAKLKWVLATMLKFINAARQGWSKKTSKKPTSLTLNLKIDEIDRN